MQGDSCHDRYDWEVSPTPRPHLTTKQLRLISVLARELNLSRSAEVLYTTQPAVSRALAELEAQLKVRLFHRTTKRVTPTAAGLRLAQRAARILEELELVREDLAGADSGAACELRVGALSLFSPQVLAGAIDRMRRLLPQVFIHVQMHALELLHAQLREGRLDVMLAHAELRVDLNTVEVVPLYEEHSTVLARKGHPLQRRRRVDWPQLAQQAWVLPPPHTPLRPMIDRMLALHRDSGRADMGPDVQVDSLLTALALTARTDMLWAIASHMATHFAASGDVIEIATPAPLVRGPFCAFHLREHRSDAVLRCFLDCLRDESTQSTA